MSIYHELVAIGAVIENHESDLYTPVTPESTTIVNGYIFRSQVKPFKSERDEKMWYEIPFAYEPFYYEHRASRA